MPSLQFDTSPRDDVKDLITLLMNQARRTDPAICPEKPRSLAYSGTNGRRHTVK